MLTAAQGTIHVIQGEHAVADHADAVMTTVLGSCVATCLHDPVRAIGGMNHFLLPAAQAERDVRHASAAIERLLNNLLKQGARREHLVAKVFGGARMLQGLPDIGRRNGEAAMIFLRSEGIRIAAQSLGGIHARRVRFWPHSGRAQAMLLACTADPAETSPPKATQDGTIELF